MSNTKEQHEIVFCHRLQQPISCYQIRISFVSICIFFVSYLFFITDAISVRCFAQRRSRIIDSYANVPNMPLFSYTEQPKLWMLSGLLGANSNIQYEEKVFRDKWHRTNSSSATRELIWIISRQQMKQHRAVPATNNKNRQIKVRP